MSKNIITISREFGSGGRIIAKEVAEKLGYAFYDRALVDSQIRTDELSAESMRDIEDSLNEALLFQLAVDGNYAEHFWESAMMPSVDKLFLMQEKIINNMIAKGPSVIVGTGADFICREKADCASFFIYAPFDDRKKRVIEDYHIPAKDAEAKIRRRDKLRKEHYESCTFQKWGDVHNYDLSLDSSFLGLSKTRELIIRAVE